MFLYFFVQKPLRERFSLFFLEHSTIKLQKKKVELNFLLKLSDLKSNFTLILGYLHPALNSPGQIVTLMWSLEPSAIRLMAVTCNFWLGRGGGGTMKRTPEFIPVVLGICHPPQVTFSSSNQGGVELANDTKTKRNYNGTIILELASLSVFNFVQTRSLLVQRSRDNISNQRKRRENNFLE